jgi:hypothetical protein
MERRALYAAVLANDPSDVAALLGQRGFPASSDPACSGTGAPGRVQPAVRLPASEPRPAARWASGADAAAEDGAGDRAVLGGPCDPAERGELVCETPLHLCAGRGGEVAERVAALLLGAGADPNAQDAEGRRPIHYAAQG